MALFLGSRRWQSQKDQKSSSYISSAAYTGNKHLSATIIGAKEAKDSQSNHYKPTIQTDWRIRQRKRKPKHRAINQANVCQAQLLSRIGTRALWTPDATRTIGIGCV